VVLGAGFIKTKTPALQAGGKELALPAGVAENRFCEEPVLLRPVQGAFPSEREADAVEAAEFNIFGGSNAFLKRPGTVTVSIGPAIDPAGLSAEEVNARAEAWMEAEMARISPHLYRRAHETAQPATQPAA